MKQERIPDGKGGWKLVEATGEKTTVKAPDEKVQDKLQKAQEEDFFTKVGECTHFLNKSLEIYARDHNLTEEEIIAAVYLENINNRQYYPKGVKKFNKICADVWDWFQVHKD